MEQEPYLKMYICILDEVLDGMAPTLEGHSVLGAHLKYNSDPLYGVWLSTSYRKVTVKVDRKRFEQIKKLSETQWVYEGHENKTLNGETSCLVTLAWSNDTPRALKNARLWSPKPVNDLNIEKVAEYYIKTFGEHERLYIKNLPFEDLVKLHHTLGQNIRNEFKLWFYNWIPVIKSDGADHSPNHPDAISMKVIECIHMILNKE